MNDLTTWLGEKAMWKTERPSGGKGEIDGCFQNYPLSSSLATLFILGLPGLCTVLE